MKQFVTKNSKAWFIAIIVLLVLGFIGTDGFQWYQWAAIIVAVSMALYYVKNKIQG